MQVRTDGKLHDSNFYVAHLLSLTKHLFVPKYFSRNPHAANPRAWRNARKFHLLPLIFHIDEQQSQQKKAAVAELRKDVYDYFNFCKINVSSERSLNAVNIRQDKDNLTKEERSSDSKFGLGGPKSSRFWVLLQVNFTKGLKKMFEFI